MPRVSVIAQCFNHARFLVECLDSVEAQTFRDFELIIVDDASTDDSVQRLREWVARCRPETRVLALETNQGVAGALNAALAVTRGALVIRVATDDVWQPLLLERLVASLDDAPAHATMAFSDAACMDAASRDLGCSFIAMHRPGFIPRSGALLNDLAVGNFIPAPTVLMRKAALDAAGAFDSRLMYEDWDMWLRLASIGPFVFVPELLARYRIVDGSLARTLFESPDAATSARLAHTHCLMAEKVLTFPVVHESGRRFWRAVHFENALKLFLRAESDRLLLRKGLRWYRSPRHVAVSMTASLGLPRTWVERVRGLAGV
jgi:glycosyltransferase involved in cell wall biosynthesis